MATQRSQKKIKTKRINPRRPKRTETDAEPTRESGDVTKIWADLMDGNKRFALGQHSTGQLVSSRKSLVEGQKPDVIVISCSDSRVPPELVFDKNLGELFVIRTAGNVADPIALGSIEYAAEHLHSKDADSSRPRNMRCGRRNTFGRQNADVEPEGDRKHNSTCL